MALTSVAKAVEESDGARKSWSTPVATNATKGKSYGSNGALNYLRFTAER
jgi:hypothetical protein